MRIPSYSSLTGMNQDATGVAEDNKEEGQRGSSDRNLEAHKAKTNSQESVRPGDEKNEGLHTVSLCLCEEWIPEA